MLLPRAHPRPLCSSAFAAQRGHARLAPQRHPPGRPHSSSTAPLTLPVAVFTARDDSTPAFRAACVRMEQLHLWHRRLGRLAQRSTLPSRFWSSRRALQLLHESPVRVSGRNHIEGLVGRSRFGVRVTIPLRTLLYRRRSSALVPRSALALEMTTRSRSASRGSRATDGRIGDASWAGVLKIRRGVRADHTLRCLNR